MSEITRLRMCIEEESEAMKRAMNGFAVASSHETITHPCGRLDTCLGYLTTRVGEHAAIEMLIEELEACL